MSDDYEEWKEFIGQKLSERDEFKKIPLKDRWNAYSNNIITHNNLWTKPTYEEGEIWTFYGGGYDCLYEIVEKTKKQVLCKKLYTYGGFSDGDWSVFDIHNEYANCGTPEMRIRIK